MSARQSTFNSLAAHQLIISIIFLIMKSTFHFQIQDSQGLILTKNGLMGKSKFQGAPSKGVFDILIQFINFIQGCNNYSFIFLTNYLIILTRFKSQKVLKVWSLLGMSNLNFQKSPHTVIKIEKTKRKMQKAKQQLKIFQLYCHTMGFIHDCMQVHGVKSQSCFLHLHNMNSAGRVIRVTCNVESSDYSVHVQANLFQLYILVSTLQM